MFSRRRPPSRNFAEAGAVFVVNDRPTMQRFCKRAASGAGGSLPGDARSVAGDGFLGFSTHNAEQMRAAGAEPSIRGVRSGFPDRSKERPDPVTGLEGLRQYVVDRKTAGGDRRDHARKRTPVLGRGRGLGSRNSALIRSRARTRGPGMHGAVGEKRG